MHKHLRIHVPVLLVLSACSGGGGSSEGGGGSTFVEVPQIGALSVTLEAGHDSHEALIEITQPAHHILAATAAYDDGADTLTITLDLINGFPRLIHNPKVVFTAISEGVAGGDRLYDGAAYLYYGPNAMLASAESGAVSRTIVVSGVLGASPEVTLDLEVVDHPSIFVSDYGGPVAHMTQIDTSGVDEVTLIDIDPTSFGGSGDPDGGDSGGDQWFHTSAQSADSRYLYMAGRNQPAVQRFDTTDIAGAVLVGADLTDGPGIAFDRTGSVGSVAGIVRSGDFLYALVVDNAHGLGLPDSDGGGGSGPTGLALVKVDASTLAEVDRLTLFTADGGSSVVGRGLSMSGDGSRVAFGIRGLGEVVVADLASLSVVDTFLVDVGSPDGGGEDKETPRYTALNEDGSEVYVVYPSSSEMDRIHVASGDIVTETTPTIFGDPKALNFGPDGKVYYLIAGEPIAIFDPVAGDFTEIDASPGGYPEGLVFDADGTRYYVIDESDGVVHVLEIDTNTPLTSASGNATILATGFQMEHDAIITSN